MGLIIAFLRGSRAPALKSERVFLFIHLSSYTDLVPVLYHLYGDYFEDLSVATLTNHNPEAVTLRIETRVPSYTDMAIATLTLKPGETAVVRQDPPLLPEALELLHGMRNATLHIRVDLLLDRCLGST